MIFEKNELETSLLVPPLEKNQILISLKMKDKIVFQVLIDSTENEITVDRHENISNIFKGYKVKDGILIP